MSWLQVVVLSVVQGLTEFLPVSSSGHLAIASRLFFADDAGASFTAVTQLGTELAVLVYFARDIGRIVKAWFGGLFAAARRNADYWLGWYVIIGTIPIGVFGLLFKDEIRTGARNLWLIAIALIVFSAVIAAAEYFGRQTRHVEQLTWRDSVTVGLAQCLALVPGVSRSGATISAGLFLGLDRETAARFGFLLAIPAVFASGLFSLPDAFHPVGEGMSASGPQLLRGDADRIRGRVRRGGLVPAVPGAGTACTGSSATGCCSASAVLILLAGTGVVVGDMTVILLRHGRSTSNTAHTLAGRTEGVDLDDKGREQAQALVERIGVAADQRDRAFAAAALRTHRGAAGRRAGSGAGRRRADLRGRLRPVDRPQDRRSGQGAAVGGGAAAAQRGGVPRRGGAGPRAGPSRRGGARARPAAGRPSTVATRCGWRARTAT